MVSTPLYDPLALALGSEEDDLLNFAPKTGLFAHLGQEAAVVKYMWRKALTSSSAIMAAKFLLLNQVFFKASIWDLM